MSLTLKYIIGLDIYNKTCIISFFVNKTGLYVDLPFCYIFQGRIAKKPKSSKDFNRRSAEESFRSLVKTHDKYGWVTPPLADG